MSKQSSEDEPRKQCNLCKEMLPLSAYWKSKAAKDGLQHRCKKCCKRVNKTWRQQNPEKTKEYNASQPSTETKRRVDRAGHRRRRREQQKVMAAALSKRRPDLAEVIGTEVADRRHVGKVLGITRSGKLLRCETADGRILYIPIEHAERFKSC